MKKMLKQNWYPKTKKFKECYRTGKCKNNIYTSMRLSSYLWELIVFRNHVQSMDINIRHLRFFTIYFIQNPIFSKKYFKAISGQIFMKFISRHAEFLEFYWFPGCHFRGMKFKSLEIWIWNQDIAISIIVGTSSHIKIICLF
jgi:hypothetical protein